MCEKKRIDVLLFAGGTDSQYPSLAFTKIQHHAFTDNGHLAFVASDGTELITNMNFIISFPTEAAIAAEKQYAEDQMLKKHVNDNKIILTN